MEDASEQNALWKLNTSMTRISGGNCFNCDYIFPTEFETKGEIEVIFNRHAHASFSINGGEVQNIIPLYFGFSQINHFEDYTKVPIPELEGWWT